MNGPRAHAGWWQSAPLVASALCTLACSAPLPKSAAVKESTLGLDRRSGTAPGIPSARVRLCFDTQFPANQLELSDGSGQRLRLENRAGTLRQGDRVLPEPWLVSPEQACILRLGGQAFAGEVWIEAASVGGFTVWHELELERYLERVLAAELALWSAPSALLEAQAIAARSYAVHQMHERGALFADTRDQVFSAEPVDTLPANLRAKLAHSLAATRGQLLCMGNDVLDARFHAACGGHTEEGSAIFPELPPGALLGVACPPCQASSPTWSYTASRADLDRLALDLGLGPNVQRFQVTRSGQGGRWLELEFFGSRASARCSLEALRRRFGPSLLPSSNVRSTWPKAGSPISKGLNLRGTGAGHGVGLCQAGAKELAEQGWSSERILQHYYPAARIGALRSAAPVPHP